MELYVLKEGKLTKIVSLLEERYSWVQPFNGWPQIIVSYYRGHKTNPIWYYEVLRFTGEKYETYYAPEMTLGEMRDLGLKAYDDKDYTIAETYFRNILNLTYDDTTVDVNNLALSLLRQNKLTESSDLLKNEL